LLLLDDAFDLAVLDLLEGLGSDVSARALFPCLFERGGAKEAADMVGAERRRGALAHAIARFSSGRARV